MAPILRKIRVISVSRTARVFVDGGASIVISVMFGLSSLPDGYRFKKARVPTVQDAVPLAPERVGGHAHHSLSLHGPPWARAPGEFAVHGPLCWLSSDVFQRHGGSPNWRAGRRPPGRTRRARRRLGTASPCCRGRPSPWPGTLSPARRARLTRA